MMVHIIKYICYRLLLLFMIMFITYDYYPIMSAIILHIIFYIQRNI